MFYAVQRQLIWKIPQRMFQDIFILSYFIKDG